MENIIKISNFEIKVKSVLVISLTVFIVFICLLSYIDRAILITASISITSSFIGIGGGYCVSRKIDLDKQKIEAIRLKKNMLKLLENEIYVNGVIFKEHYDKEKVKDGPLNLKEKKEFKVDVWHKLEFKIFAEGVGILDENKFTELCELYRRFEIINLQKALGTSITQTSKKNILNYIHKNLMQIDNYLRAD